jgi:PhnB protein
MARTNIYLNFQGNTEQAFEFYRSVFGGEFSDLQRMSDVPGFEVDEADKNKLMHVSLPLLGTTVLMGTDALESMGHIVSVGNNVSISLEPDSLAETERIFSALSEGASDITELQKMFWGAYYGAFADRFGIRWMFNFVD